MKILIICGSLREQSQTRTLTGIAYEHAKKTHPDTEYLDLAKTRIANFQGFEAKYDKTTNKTIKQVQNADVLIIGSPIYNGLPASQIKNLFEHINYKALEGKTAALILKASSTISFLQVQSQLQALMNYFRVTTNPRAVFASDQDFNENKLTNPQIKKRITQLINETTKMAQHT
jgi:FMN reductase